MLDPQGSDSLAKVARRIARGSEVLDVGCGSGVLGQYLVQEKECIVDAVDLDRAAVEAAARFCRTSRCVDLDRARLSDVLGDRRYSVVVCADVLEHLKSPSAVLGDLRKLLLPSGRLLVSIPNVAYAGVVAELLSGRFRYRDEGILDRTHLHFFTRDSLLELLKVGGFGVRELDAVVVDLTRSEFSPCIDVLPSSVVDCLMSGPDSLTYQFIAECVPRDDTSAVRSVGSAGPVERRALRFYVQAYWRSASESFSEDRYCWAVGEVGRDHQTVKLELPSKVKSPVEIRLDPADRPGYIRIHDIALHDHLGDCLWRWDHDLSGLAQCARHELELATSGEGALLLAAGIDPWVVLPIPRESLARVTQGGRLDVDLSWPRSSDFGVLARRLQDLEGELRREVEDARGRERAVRVHAEDLKVQLDRSDAQFQRCREEVEQLEKALARARDSRALAELEQARAVNASVQVWRTLVSGVLTAVDRVLSWPPWRIGDRFGNLVNQVRRQPEIDLPQELRAACSELKEAAHSPPEDLAAWLSRQEAALANVSARVTQVIDSKRYRLGVSVERPLGLLPWAAPAAPAPVLETALEIATSALRDMRSSLPARRAPSEPARQRFLDIVDIAVTLREGSVKERENLERIIQATSPPYRLWLAAPASLRDTPWLVDFARTQGATVTWLDSGQSARDLLERLLSSSSPAVAFVPAEAAVGDGWIDDALFALNAAGERDAVPIALTGGPSSSEDSTGWPCGILAKKRYVAGVLGPANPNRARS